MTKNYKILIIFGTRPEIIKLFPVIRAIKYRDNLKTIIVCTGQHKQIIAPLINAFQIKLDYNLSLMKSNQNLYQLSSDMIRSFKKIIIETKPDLVLVQGDTTTAFLGALSAFYSQIPIGHIEAGLRTNDRYQPFPEEINRRLISTMADLHFCPTQGNKQNLILENVSPKSIYVTGNTGIDTLFWSARNSQLLSPIKTDLNKKLVLITLHRRESFGKPLKKMLMAIRQLAMDYRNTNFICPVHPNPNVKLATYEILDNLPNVVLTDPLDYLDFIKIMKQAYIILTDSGGIQEEALSLKIPVLILRQKTERTEAIISGGAELIGIDTSKIVKRVGAILKNPKELKKFKFRSNPFGDGKAAERIVKVIASFLNHQSKYKL